MRVFSKLAIICVAALTAGSPVHAADRATGTYIGGALGANLANDSDLSGNGINTDVGSENGIAGVLALGQSYANGFRGEVEFG